MPHLKRVTAVLAVAAAALAAAPSALAGVATYTNNTEFNIPHGLTVNSSLLVPSGRTAIQSIEVTGIQVDWPASGQELSVQLLSPDGASMFLWEVGCGGAGSYPPNTNFTISDAGTQPADGAAIHCTDEFLVGGVLRPDGPAMNTKKMSFFNGKAPSGNWTLRAEDSGAIFVNQGSIESWSLRIVHVPPVLTASPPKSADLDGKLKVLATADADGTATAGAAKINLKAGQQAAIPFKVSKKLRKRIEDKGKSRVKVKVAFTDVTGGTANAVVPVKVTD